MNKTALILLPFIVVVVLTEQAAYSSSESALRPSIEFSIDSGDYGGSETINVYSVTIGLDYVYSDRLSFSISWAPYVYQDDTYTDVILLNGRPVHHRDRYGSNPHRPEDTFEPVEGFEGGARSAHLDQEDGKGRDSMEGAGRDRNEDVKYRTGSDDEAGKDIKADDRHQGHHTSEKGDDEVGDVSKTATVRDPKPVEGDHYDSGKTGMENTDGKASYETPSSTPDKHMVAQEASGVQDSGQEGAGTSKGQGLQKKKRYKRHGAESGIGDMDMKMFYRLVDENGLMPEAIFEAGIKIPLADEDKGLGTGEFDYLLGLHLSKDLESCYLSAGVSYNFIGDPDYYDLNDYLSGYVGISFYVLDQVEFSLELDAAEAASDQSDPELSVGISVGYEIQGFGYLTAGFGKGLEDGSPDYQGYVGYSVTF